MRYAAAGEGSPTRDRYYNVFTRTGVVVTVDQGGDYENWQTTAIGVSLRLNINKIADWPSIMNAAVKAMEEYNATQARVMPGRDTLRMADASMSVVQGVSGTKIA